MSTVVFEALAALTAAETVVSPAPELADPEGFGVDLQVLLDAEPDHRVVTGSLAVAYDVARRFGTDVGSVPSDPDYGCAFELFLHGAIDGGPRAWEALCAHEARKDPRIADAACSWVTTDNRAWDVVVHLEIPTPAGTDSRELVFRVESDKIERLVR